MTVRLLDSAVDVQAPSAIRGAVADLYPAGPSTPPTAQVVVSEASLEVSDAIETLSAESPEHALLLVAMFLNRICLGQCASLAFHAGAVARDGGVTAFAAESGTGKSTLTAALLQQGWDYVSDEALVVDDETGTVRPYPKPLSLHGWTLKRLGLSDPAAGLDERLVPAHELAADHAAPGLQVRNLVMLRRGSSSSLVPQPRPAGTAHLLRHSFNHYRDPAGSFTLASGLTQQADCWLLTIGDPVDAARLLSGALA